MAFVQKPNTGAMFPNDKKETERHPDYKGDFNIDGVNYHISGYLVTSSLVFREASQQFQRPAHKAATQDARLPFDDYDDDMPF